MNNHQLVKEVELLVQYTTPLYNHLVNLKQVLNQILVADEFHYPSAIQELKQYLENIRKEVLLSYNSTEHLHKQIYEYLQRNVELLRGSLKKLEELIDEMLDWLNKADFKEQVNEWFLPNLEEEMRKIHEQELYDIKPFRELLDVSYRIWREYIHNKDFWLYHGTSALFLSNIQKNGLDNSKITRGVKRAIETISKIYTQYSFATDKDRAALKGFNVQDIDTELFKRQVSLSTIPEVFKPLMGSGIPAFLYELLNEDNIKEEYKASLLAQLPEDERHMLEVIWRFGRILRARNKVAILHIKVNSDFLNYYNYHDFISHFNEFISECFPSQLSAARNFTRLQNTIMNVDWPHRALEWMLHLYGASTKEIRFKEVPARFIYVEVTGLFGRVHLIPISKLNDGVIKKLVLHGQF